MVSYESVKDECYATLQKKAVPFIVSYREPLGLKHTPLPKRTDHTLLRS